MSHIVKEYFEGHPAKELFDEAADCLGVDLSVWEFADGVEVAEDEVEYLTVVYSSTNKETLKQAWSLYAAIILNESGEWEMQQFGMSQED